MKMILKLITAVTFTALTLPGLAGDAAAGKAKSAVCAACHGPEGISAADIWPNLAGQKKGYLVKQIKAFRDGTRKDPSMQPMVANLTDEDIENLATYYSSMK